MQRVRLVIHGSVQGVSFRYYARQQAVRLGLVGWVKNRPDGCVEAVVEGEDRKVRQFVRWSHDGPALARVEHVDEFSEQVQGNEDGFHILQ